MDEAEHRERFEQAKARTKLAHRRAAETHERSALQYERLASVAEGAGDSTRAVRSRGKAAEARRHADAQRAMGGPPVRGPS